MSRRVRFAPEGGGLFEVSSRTVQSRLLLRPSPALNEIILGVLGRGQRLYPVEVCGFSFLSNHFHLLLRVPDVELLARFMGYVKSNLAREVNRLVGWEGIVWSRRFDAILISDEEAAQVARLRYVLSQGCKEGLVERAQEWPGIHMIGAILNGEPMKGTWFNRSREYSARLRSRGEKVDPLEHAAEETLVLSRLPCWRHLSPEEYRKRVEGLVQEVEQEAAVERARQGIKPLGVAKILRQHPHSKPKKSKTSPAPGFHAATKAARRALWEAYGWFYAAFREAAEKLKTGDRSARFPVGSFPPGLPFVRACAHAPP